MTLATVYSELKVCFNKNIYSPEEIPLLVIYSVSTHIYKSFSAFPVLLLVGDFQTGKNRRAEVMEPVMNNPKTFITPSVSALFRTIKENEGVVVIDEADSSLRNKVIEEIILAGFKRDGMVIRSVNDKLTNDWVPKGFLVYCPKIIITREGTTSEALLSLSIKITTLPLPKDSKVPSILPNEATEELRSLRKELDKHIALQNIDFNNIECHPSLSNRQVEVFTPLYATASILGEKAKIDLDEFVENVYLPQVADITALTKQEDILIIINECWTKGVSKVDLSLVEEKLKNISSSQYKFVTRQEIASVLRSLSFKLKRGNKGYYVLYNPQLIESWKERYGISSLNDAPSTQHTQSSKAEYDHFIDATLNWRQEYSEGVDGVGSELVRKIN